MSPKKVRIALEPAALSHAKLLWRWRNETETLRQSGNMRRVPWKTHYAWLSRKLSDPGFGLWIAMDGSGRPVGQLRLERRSPDLAELSISVDKRHRGRGLGTALLLSTPRRLGARALRRLTAHVKIDNTASAIAFLKAGYRFLRVERLNGVSVYRLEKDL